MATMDTDPDLDLEQDLADEDELGFAPYRALSKAAVASLVVTLLGLLGLMFPVLLALAGFGIVLGLLARRSLRRFPDELTGRWPALFGMVGGLLVLVGGVAWHTYVHFTEVPDGYTRISYSELQPTGKDPETNMPILPDHLNGQRIFIKGYVHPSVASMGPIKKFILVPDMGTCCFGGQPKRLTDMIEVTLTNSQNIRYSTLKRKLGGILTVHHQIRQVTGGLTGGFYELTADYVQ